MAENIEVLSLFTQPIFPEVHIASLDEVNNVCEVFEVSIRSGVDLIRSLLDLFHS